MLPDITKSSTGIVIMVFWYVMCDLVDQYSIETHCLHLYPEGRGYRNH
jgi:hypothetical protein